MSVGFQTHTLTRTLQRELGEARADGRMGELCPILTFKSLADATVRIEDAVSSLYARVENPESELVIFDVNQRANMKRFFRRQPAFAEYRHAAPAKARRARLRAPQQPPL